MDKKIVLERTAEFVVLAVGGIFIGFLLMVVYNLLPGIGAAVVDTWRSAHLGSLILGAVVGALAIIIMAEIERRSNEVQKVLGELDKWHRIVLLLLAYSVLVVGLMLVLALVWMVLSFLYYCLSSI